MKHTPVVLLDEPRAFAPDEIFFSTTDARGVIETGNEVFVRISGYRLEELISQPHNLIRHPDMPRAAFRLVWRYLKAGRPVAALVKNRANDGRYYWVVALIAPSGKGYLSVRFKPTGSFLGIAQQVYAAMLAAEKKTRSEGAGEDAAMDAGEAVLVGALQANKISDYDAFMRLMLSAELKSRDEILVREGRNIIRPLPPSGVAAADAGQLAALYAEGGQAYDHLNQLFHRLDDFVALQKALEDKSVFVNRLTGELKVAAMNVSLASSRLGGEGLSLGVIAHYMGGASGGIAEAVSQLVKGIAHVSSRLQAVIFNLAAARLQLEMLMGYVHELITSCTSAAARKDRHHLIHTLHLVFTATLEQTTRALQELGGNTHELNATSHSLSRQVLGLQISQLSGQVESARLVHLESFADVFTSIRKQIYETRRELDELGEALDQLESLAVESPLIAAEIKSTATRMEQGIDVLGRAAPAETAAVAVARKVVLKPDAPTAPPAAAPELVETT